MNQTLKELDYNKKYIAQSSQNKNKMQSLANKQKSRQDLEYRTKEINNARMNQIKINQKRLEQINKDMIKNSNAEMMEKNHLDPKIIEAARIRMENSDSESDDSILLEKDHQKRRVVKQKLNLADKFFHGDPLIKKPPLHPYSFNTYTHVIDRTTDSQRRKKKKKKKKGMDPADFLKLMQMNQNGSQKQNPMMKTTFLKQLSKGNGMNQDALDRLSKQMWDQKDMLNDINNRMTHLQREKDLKNQRRNDELMKIDVRFDEYDRHHRMRRKVDDMREELEKQANIAGINRIRAVHGQDQLMNEFKNQLQDVQNQRNSRFQNFGRRSLGNF